MLPSRPPGKSVIQYYPNGDAGGLMCIELSNWSGLGFRIPRAQLAGAINLEYVNTPGVYILLGSNEEDEPMAYVGKSEAILKRLNDHAVKKDFWTEAIAFVSKDGHLNAGHIGWLESTIYKLVASARRVKLENTVVPTESTLSTAVRDGATEYLLNAAFLLTAMGKNFLESTGDRVASQNTGTLFIRDYNRGIDARGILVDHQFILLKGSRIHAREVPSTPRKAVALFESLRDEDKLILVGNEVFETCEDLEFSSPSGAGVFVTFRSTNGRDAWKLQDGRTLKEYQNGELERVEGRNLFSDAEPLDPSTASDEG